MMCDLAGILLGFIIQSIVDFLFTDWIIWLTSTRHSIYAPSALYFGHFLSCIDMSNKILESRLQEVEVPCTWVYLSMLSNEITESYQNNRF